MKYIIIILFLIPCLPLHSMQEEQLYSRLQSIKAMIQQRRKLLKLTAIPSCLSGKKDTKKIFKKKPAPAPQKKNKTRASITLDDIKIHAQKCTDKECIEKGYCDRIDITFSSRKNNDQIMAGCFSLLFFVDTIILQNNGDIRMIGHQESDNTKVQISTLFQLIKSRHEHYDYILIESNHVFFDNNNMMTKSEKITYQNA